MARCKASSETILCIWSCLLGVIGISEFIFGIYFMSAVTVFSNGSPIWIGCMNTFLATLMFAIQHDAFQQYSYQPESIGRCDFRSCSCLYLSGKCRIGFKTKTVVLLFFSVLLVFVNMFNIVVCETEWRYRKNFSHEDDSTELTIQALQVVTIQSIVAVFLGVFATILNARLVYQTCIRKTNQSSRNSLFVSRISFMNPNYNEDLGPILDIYRSPRILHGVNDSGTTLNLKKKSKTTETGVQTEMPYVPRPQVKDQDKITLRVESFKTFPSRSCNKFLSKGSQTVEESHFVSVTEPCGYVAGDSSVSAMAKQFVAIGLQPVPEKAHVTVIPIDSNQCM